MELVLILALMGILLTAAISVTEGVGQVRDTNERRFLLSQARTAIEEFVVRNDRLPCPDTSGNGYEGDGSGQCPDGVVVGRLPVIALGIPELIEDRADQYFKYAVFRSGENDLANPKVQPSYVFDQEDPRKQFIATANQVAKDAGTGPGGQPYVAADGSAGAATDCGGAKVVAAAAVMVMPTDQAGDDKTSTCFRQDPLTGRDFVEVGTKEVIGWALTSVAATH